MESHISVNGRSYLLTSDDDYLYEMGADFEPHMVELFQALVGPADHVLDIGGNIGLTAILFAGLAAQVQVFEPSPSTFSILQENLKRAQVSNVDAVNLGLGDRAAELTITYGAHNRSGGFVSDRIQPGAGHVTENIQVDTLDRYLAARSAPIDFIKIDVEGFEENVLRGAAETLLRHRPLVTLELNHFCLNVLRRVTVPDFLDFLRSVFPYLYAVDSDNTTIANLHDPEAAYNVMHEHVVHFRYPNIVAGFDDKVVHMLDQLKRTARERSMRPARALVVTQVVDDGRGSLTVLSAPQRVRPNTAFWLDVEVQNGSAGVWTVVGDKPIHLSYHWAGLDGKIVLFDGLRTAIGCEAIAAGQSVRGRMRIVAPAFSGVLKLTVTLVQEGVCWFEDRGFQAPAVTMHIDSGE